MLMVPSAAMRMNASGFRGAAAWAGAWAARGFVYRLSSIPPPATEVTLRKDRRSKGVVFTGASRSHDVITAFRQRQRFYLAGAAGGGGAGKVALPSRVYTSIREGCGGAAGAAGAAPGAGAAAP